jgi:hypothetical protein
LVTGIEFIDENGGGPAPSKVAKAEAVRPLALLRASSVVARTHANVSPSKEEAVRTGTLFLRTWRRQISLFLKNKCFKSH